MLSKGKIYRDSFGDEWRVCGIYSGYVDVEAVGRSWREPELPISEAAVWFGDDPQPIADPSEDSRHADDVRSA